MDELEYFKLAVENIPDDVLAAKYDGHQGTKKKRKTQSINAVKNPNYDRIIDLHGYSSDEALQLVVRVLKEYSGRNRRILIITGKGNNSGERGPVVRNTICDYLNRGGKKIIQGFCFANRCDGGMGAIEVVTK